MKDTFPADKTEVDASAMISANSHTTLLAINFTAIGH